MTTQHQRLDANAGLFTRPARRYAITGGWSSARLLLLLLGATACTDATSPPKPSPEAATLSISPDPVKSLALGNLVVIQARARDENGVALFNVPVTWNTSDPEVVRIQPTAGYSGTASIIALRAGATTVTAKSSRVAASITISVHGPGPVATVTIVSDGTENELAVGKTSQLKVVQRDSDGVVLTTLVPTFSSSDSTIARVSGTGLVIALAPGSATLTATSDGKSASRKLTVLASEHAFMWTVAEGMIDLGTLPGFVSSRAVAVSSAGHVAGTLSTIADSLAHAFVRSPGASAEIRDLGGLPGGGSSEAFGVNSAGQVVGYAVTQRGVKHAMLWRATGAVVDLGTMGGGQESVALGINDAGQVVGWTNDGANVQQPFIWTESTGMRLLGVVDRFSQGIAFAINQSGVVAGESKYRPVTWTPTSPASALPLRLHDLSGRALAISNLGETVGASAGFDNGGCDYYEDYCDVVNHPMAWTSAGLPTDLQRNVGSETIATVLGINSAHQTVGGSESHHAILWSTASGVRDLGVLPGRRWSSAAAINDAGVVVGSSFNP